MAYNVQRPRSSVGEILREHYLGPRDMTVEDFAIEIGVDHDVVIAAIDGQQRLDQDLADRFADELGTTAQFWMNLDAAYHGSPRELA